ncbi:hypothetical protein EC836_103440 [Erwinia sp. JUb26]|nr:hypothetical protein EC836_103440 [Erwinia sp. JUb26]
MSVYVLRAARSLSSELFMSIADRCVIRIGDIADSTLIASIIAMQTRVQCASPAYLENCLTE